MPGLRWVRLEYTRVSLLLVAFWLPYFLQMVGQWFDPEILQPCFSEHCEMHFRTVETACCALRYSDQSLMLVIQAQNLVGEKW